jgi:secreted trypsin-like serine protease
MRCDFRVTAAILCVMYCCAIWRAEADDLTSYSPPGKKIVGGDVAKIEDWPWMATLSRVSANGREPPHCGAVAIADRWVLTAAHCVVENAIPRKPDSIFVTIGLAKWAAAVPRENGFGAAEIIVHEKYKAQTHENDVALVRLGGAWSGQTLPLAVSRRSDPDNGSMWLAGHGKIRDRFSTSSDLLLDAPMTPVKHRDCETYFNSKPRWSIPVLPAHICGIDPAAEDAAPTRAACFGDSGGPLVARDAALRPYLVGIVSWGDQSIDKLSRPCLTDTPYAVFTRTSFYADWIGRFVGSVVPISPSRAALALPNSRPEFDGVLSRLAKARSAVVEICGEGARCGTSLRLGERVHLRVLSPVPGYLVLVDDKDHGSFIDQILPDPQGGNIMYAPILAGQPYVRQLGTVMKRFDAGRLRPY